MSECRLETIRIGGRDTRLDALLDAIAQPLHTAAKSVLREPKRSGEPPAMVDFCSAFANVILQHERAAVFRQPGEAPLEALMQCLVCVTLRDRRKTREVG